MVKHVLKDGSEVDDVTGHVIKMNEFESLYKLIDGLNQKGIIYETVSASD